MTTSTTHRSLRRYVSSSCWMSPMSDWSSRSPVLRTMPGRSTSVRSSNAGPLTVTSMLSCATPDREPRRAASAMIVSCAFAIAFVTSAGSDMVSVKPATSDGGAASAPPPATQWIRTVAAKGSSEWLMRRRVGHRVHRSALLGNSTPPSAESSDDLPDDVSPMTAIIGRLTCCPSPMPWSFSTSSRHCARSSSISTASRCNVSHFQ
mmetsp:Transcript_18758/g.58180  ORF Transcript_18758/g.58180 Transcript_18758/m.58180 type:complete len:206 (-) Transcript_18758:13-630(-)